MSVDSSLALSLPPGPESTSCSSSSDSELVRASPVKTALFSGRSFSLDSGSNSGSAVCFPLPRTPGMTPSKDFESELSAALKNDSGDFSDEDYLIGSHLATSLPLQIPASSSKGLSAGLSRTAAEAIKRAAWRQGCAVQVKSPSWLEDDEEETDRLTPLSCVQRLSPKDSPHSDRPPRFSESSWTSRDVSVSGTSRPHSPMTWDDVNFSGSPPDLPPETYASASPASPARQRQITRLSSGGEERRIPGVKILSDFAGVDLSSGSRSRLDKLVEAQAAWLVPTAEVAMGETLRVDALGTVKMGRWRGTKALVRILRLRVGHDISQEVARELLGELAAPLRHPNLALHMATCQPDEATGEIATIYEYLSDGNVADFALRGEVDVARACVWSLSLARMLCFLHSSKPAIVVGQLRPSRLLVDSDMHVKLCDVELQQALRRKGLPLRSMDENEDDAQFRVCDAPEFDFASDPQPSSDVYSAGVVALMLLLGSVPTSKDIAAARGGRLRLFASRETKQFSAVVGLMVAEDPSERPSAADLVHKLEACCQAIRQAGTAHGGCSVS
mmetsp:Transcript_8080/g.18809  ORF Transcript_8080/g.18809 Transcript_8080/m.18809 type:complete len:559 (-) Transcript_8080:354-2030(-)